MSNAEQERAEARKSAFNQAIKNIETRFGVPFSEYMKGSERLPEVQDKINQALQEETFYHISESLRSSLDREEQLIAENERLKATQVKLWDCPDCGFAFDSIHVDVETNEYSCPVCQVAEQDKEIKRLQKVEEDYKTLQQIMDRARQLAFLAAEDEEPGPRFKMDANGNLTRIEES